ncbi:MAG: hypothetical protein ACI8QF_001190 [Limisphaerales bacterium]|jgi:hypothetical protein
MNAMDTSRHTLDDRLILACLLAVSCASMNVVAQDSPASPAYSEAAVKNPYYSDRASPPWKLWFEDDSAVDYSRKAAQEKNADAKVITRTLKPPPLAKRFYPELSSAPTGTAPTYPFKIFQSEPKAAGMWDDSVASLDGNHVRLRKDYRFGGRKILFAGQMVQVLHGSPKFVDRNRIGINFAWQSFARKGHHLFVGDLLIRRMEETFTFANCLYASPGWLSRTDVMPDRIVDSYDGLFGHYYNSLGQSGSEAHAMAKMMYAGAHLPRETKNMMKRHGVYPLTMLTIFKATLPYRDGSGKEVPYEHELRHRPSYASNGAGVSARYVSRELEYHLYDEAIHVSRMVEMARNMSAPPPVTLLRLIDAEGSSNNTRLLQSSSFTAVRIHGEPGERIEATVDLSESYDLNGRPLTFHAKRVYPGQLNVEVTADERGKVRIVATYDERYPGGRFPVVLWVENRGDCPGNPVFVNFHWPEADQPKRPAYFAPYKKPFMTDEDIRKFTGRGAVRDPNVQVMRNDKPAIEVGPTVESKPEAMTLRAKVGVPVSVKLTGSDPEGFQTQFYQWSGDAGRIEEDRLTYTPTDADRGKTLPVRLICSDGTGAYRGLTIRIQVD